MSKQQSCRECRRVFFGPDSHIGDNICPGCHLDIHGACLEQITRLEETLGALTTERDTYKQAYGDLRAIIKKAEVAL